MKKLPTHDESDGSVATEEEQCRNIDEIEQSDDDDEGTPLNMHPFYQDVAAEGRPVKSTLPPDKLKHCPNSRNIKELTVSQVLISFNHKQIYLSLHTQVAATVVMRDLPSKNRYHVDFGPNAMEKFLTWLMDVAKEVETYTHEPIHMTAEDKEDFNNATACYLCNVEYTDGDVRTADHNHCTSNYRGSLAILFMW